MRLSVRSLLLAAVVALLAVAAVWGAEAFGLWRWVLCLLVGGLVLEWWWARNLGLTLHLEAKDPPRLGVPLRVRVRLDADGAVRARHRLLGNDSLRPLSGDGRLGDGSIYDAWVLPVRLGATALEDQWLELAGLFGLGYWHRLIKVTTLMQVAPAQLCDRIGTPGSALPGAGSRPRVGQGRQMFALRDQRPGEAAVHLDWKATARRGRPVIREMEAEEQFDLMLVLDAGLGAGVVQGALTRFGQAANTAARLAEYADLIGDRVGLLLYADRVLARVPVGRGRTQVARLRSLLAASDALPQESNPLEAMLEIRSMLRHRTLVMVFADLDDPDVAGQLGAAVRLLRPAHFPLVAACRDEELEALGGAWPNHWRDPWNALAVEELERVSESTRLRLRRLGTEVVLTRPGELEVTLWRRYERLRRERRI